jgi:acetyl esterase/lipase
MKWIIRSLLVGVLAGMTGLGVGHGANVARAATTPYSLYQNISYCTINGNTQLADLYVPNPLPAGPMPAVLYFHGGSDGNYKGDIRSALPHLQLNTLTALINAGYEVWSFNWASASSSSMPDALTWEFAKCAVRTVRANAAGLDVDPKRIAAWGESNGGGIASMLGTTTTAQGWDVGPYLSTSSRVEAVVDWCGANVGQPYVTRDDAPFLIQVGAQDPQVVWSQSLYSTLQSTGVYAQYQAIQNAGHQLLPVINPTTGLPMTISPSPDVLVQQVVSFLNSKLKYNSNPLPQ